MAGRTSKPTGNEHHVMAAWISTTEENNVLPFRLIANWSGVPIGKVRRAVRAAARKGYLELATGFSDEGVIMGKGYMPTLAGLSYIKSEFPQP